MSKIILIVTDVNFNEVIYMTATKRLQEAPNVKILSRAEQMQLMKQDIKEEIKEEKREAMFWDINPSLTYNALFNFIIGNRGGGKTYGTKQYVIKRYLKTGEQFVYVRRYKDEIKDTKTYFTDIANKFPGHEFTVRGNELRIDGKAAGYAISLSTSKLKKSVAYPNVSTIIFDEFIIDKGFYRYLPNEVEYFLDLYETIARMRDNVRVYFLSNAVTVANPYFIYFKLKVPTGSKNIICKNDILIEMVNKTEYIEAKKKTRFGRMIDGTAYGKYSIENEFLRDNNTFVEKKTGECHFKFSFKFKSQVYGVWFNFDLGNVYISNDVDKTQPVRYVFTKQDHEPNTLLITSINRSQAFKFVMENFKMGNVRFESIEIKSAFLDLAMLFSHFK